MEQHDDTLLLQTVEEYVRDLEPFFMGISIFMAVGFVLLAMVLASWVWVLLAVFYLPAYMFIRNYLRYSMYMHIKREKEAGRWP